MGDDYALRTTFKRIPPIAMEQRAPDWPKAPTEAKGGVSDPRQT